MKKKDGSPQAGNQGQTFSGGESGISLEVLEVSPVGMAVVRGGEVVFLNAAFALLLGFPDVGAAQTDSVWLTHFSPELAAAPAEGADGPPRGWSAVAARGQEAARWHLQYSFQAVTWEGERAWLVSLVPGVPPVSLVPSPLEHPLFRSFLLAAPVVIWAVDSTGIFIFSEGKGLEGLGLKPGQVVGQSVFEFYRANPRIDQNVRRALAGESFSNELTVGESIFETYHFPLRDKGDAVVGMVGISTDITEAHRTQEALSQSREMLRAVFDAIPHTLAIRDREHRYLMVNRAWCEAFAISEEEAVGSHVLLPGRQSKVEREKVLVEDQEVLARDAGPIVHHTVRTTTKGENRDFRVTKALFRDSRRQVAGLVAVGEDFTEQRQAERELQRKNELLDTILAHLPVGLMVIDKDLRIVAFNRKAELIQGLPGDFLRENMPMEELVRANAERGEFGPGDVETLVRERMVELAKKEATRFTRKRSDGTYLEFQQTPLPGGGLIPVISDVTEQKRIEEELRRNQTLLETVFDALPAFLVVKDTESRYLFANRTWLESYGMTREEVVGKHTLEVTTRSEEERRAAYERDRLVMEDSQEMQVAEILRTDLHGNTMVLHDVRAPLLDETGRLTGLISIAIDVTENRKTEQALQQFKSTLDRTLDCVFMFEPENLRFLYANRGAMEQVGYTEEELLRMTPLDIKPAYTEQTFRVELRPLLAGEEKWHTFRTVHRRKDGVEVPVEIFLQYVTLDGSSPRFVAIVRDTTERDRLEAQLRQSQKLQAVGTLAGGIAHDFNNILVPIISYTEMALGEAEKGSEAERWLQNVSEASRRARDLVARILLFSRQAKSEFEVVYLGPVVGEVLNFLRSTLPATVTITESILHDPPVKADPNQIYEVLMNLCINAGQAMAGGGELKVTLELRDLDNLECLMERRISGLHASLSVSDTGLGMEQETLGRIFEPFFTTKTVGKGTGLGLSMVLGVLEQHQGAIRVESTPGVGTTFELFFAVVEAPEASGAPSPPLIQRGNERLLVVDDEPAIVEVSRAILATLGYRVTGSTDSQEALALLESDPQGFDLLLTDLTMPGMTGDELARRLRAINPDVPIIVCTGYGQGALEDAASREAITHLLNKPFLPAELAKLVRELLDAAAARRSS